MNTPSTQRPGRVISWLLERSTREAEVQQVEAIGPNLQRVTFGGEQLRGAAWTPGDMVQIILSGSTLLGPWELRSYTPFTVDPDAGTMQILAVVHGGGPGSDWFDSVQVGTRCRFVGPRTALPLAELQRPLVFFGDETSFSSALALHATSLGYEGVQLLFEVEAVEASRSALARWGLTEAVRFVPREENDRHLDALACEVVDAYRSSAALDVVLTGKAQSIQHLYKALRATGMSRKQATNMPYWAPGKKGLKGH